MSCQAACVVDSSVLIDLAAGGLMEEVFKLPCCLIAPDGIVDHELLMPSGNEWMSHGLQRTELSGAQVAEVVLLRSRHRGTSSYDISALVLARDLKVTLVAGDRPLREAASIEGVEVHGVLWVLDMMLEHQIVSTTRAADALERMLDAGSRLPADECRRRMSKWRSDRAG